jgi:signal peptidase I
MSVADEKPEEQEEEAKKKAGSGLWDTFKIVIQALILALLIRTFLFQPFSIPSGSMEDTLLVGDFLFVSKYAYGYSRYSLPFSPDIFGGGRIFASEPQRGDIVVFKWPGDNATDYIKRVIGLPGDHIQMIDGLLYINGTPVERELIDGDPNSPSRSRVLHYKETLPNGVSYEIRDSFDGAPLDNTQEFVVPDGHYFMMGDNRDNSADSRDPNSQVGYVPAENLIGRAEIIFFSVEEDANAWEFWRWPWTVRGDRLFTPL